jgi:glucosamine 6-phosphate synthetase-like amidotransferase/phosphosugar isomerase protein
MCGIFGSSDYTRYIKLYDQNKKRGNFSYGGLFIDTKIHAIVRTKGTFNFKGKLSIELKGNKTKPLNSFRNYLGHTQAPTSSKREYTHQTTHPFNEKQWYIAHNGVLTNHNILRKDLKKFKCVNEVDTSVIPPLVCIHIAKAKNEVKGICKALSLLQGTFGLWIYNDKSNSVYLARSGSTLYANYLTNDFSSIRATGFNSLEEGTLYLQTVEGLTAVGDFKTNSPFFSS